MMMCGLKLRFLRNARDFLLVGIMVLLMPFLPRAGSMW